jgi:hypothetical protein
MTDPIPLPATGGSRAAPAETLPTSLDQEKLTCTEDSGSAQRTSYPFNFSTLREGDRDPTLNKIVTWLVAADDDYIVYLDEQDYVEWTMNDNSLLGPDTGQYLNMVGFLEAVDTSNLAPQQIESYRRLIAEGVARLFQKNLPAAQSALQGAEKWITARNTEVARRWYLMGSGAAALASALAILALGVWFLLGALDTQFGKSIYDILMGASMGGLGAWLSVIQRSRNAELDVAAGPMLHRLEGAFRIMVGVLGAMLVALAIRAGLIVQANQLPELMVICMVAGVSERLVPSFIEQVESRAVARDATVSHT